MYTTTTRAEGLRVAVLELVNSSLSTTPAEKLTAARNVARCQSETTLVKWYVNTLTELARREETAPPVLVSYATAAQKEQIIRLLNHPAVTRPMKTKVLLNINRLKTDGADAVIVQLQAHTEAPNSRRADVAGPLDREAVERFAPAAGLTYAQLATL